MSGVPDEILEMFRYHSSDTAGIFHQTDPAKLKLANTANWAGGFLL
jgi:hypothetical protein